MILSKFYFIFLTVSIGIILLTPVSIYGDYEPLGKYIWFNLSPASNSTIGGVFSSVCPPGELVNGVNENGVILCGIP